MCVCACVCAHKYPHDKTPLFSELALITSCQLVGRRIKALVLKKLTKNQSMNTITGAEKD